MRNPDEKTQVELTEFDAVPNRRGSGSLKWDYYPDPDALPMWVADMDFKSPPEVGEAIRRRAADGFFGYSLPPKGLPELVARRALELHGWEIQPEWIVWLPSLVVALNQAALTLTSDARPTIATFTPAYPPFLQAPALQSRSVLKVPMTYSASDKRWVIDVDVFRDALTPEVSVLYLCSPHNPTGRVFTRQELLSVAEICLERDITIVSDEIHCELILDESAKHIPTASLSAEIARRTVTLMSPSKTFNLAGMGCSHAIISDPALRSRFAPHGSGIVGHVNLMGYEACKAAYAFGEPWRARLLAYSRRCRDKVSHRVANDMPLLDCHVPEATYLAWIDARKTSWNDPAKRFRDHGVILSDGAAFDFPGFVRFNFGAPLSVVDEALTRMTRAFADK